MESIAGTLVTMSVNVTPSKDVTLGYDAYWSVALHNYYGAYVKFVHGGYNLFDAGV